MENLCKRSRCAKWNGWFAISPISITLGLCHIHAGLYIGVDRLTVEGHAPVVGRSLSVAILAGIARLCVALLRQVNWVYPEVGAVIV